MTKLFALFENFEIELPLDAALQGSHAGECDSDIKDLLRNPTIRNVVDSIPTSDLEMELKRYGAWDDDELTDIELNRSRILWLACCQIRDAYNERRLRL